MVHMEMHWCQFVCKADSLKGLDSWMEELHITPYDLVNRKLVYVAKTAELTDSEYHQITNDLFATNEIFTDFNKDVPDQRCDWMTRYPALKLVNKEKSSPVLLVMPQGYNYARYTSYCIDWCKTIETGKYVYIMS